MRGRKFDFERWKSHGVDGWEFEDVLETYKALENTPTADDRWHGREGLSNSAANSRGRHTVALLSMRPLLADFEGSMTSTARNAKA